MPRERWFFAQDNKRRGPVPLAQLIEGLLRTPDPMHSLVWRHGLAAWSRAVEVPEVERKLTPFVATRQAAVTPAESRAATSTSGAYPVMRAPTREERAARPAGGPRYQEEEARPAAAMSSGTLVASSAAGVVVLAFLAWLFWPRPVPKVVSATDAGLITLKEGSEPAPPGSAGTPGGATKGPGHAPTTVPPGATKGQAPPPVPVQIPVATPTPPPVAGLGDHEQNLPQAELAKLRGVAGWTGTTLIFTLYNGSSWRVTELFVKPSRLINEQFVEDTAARKLLPPGDQAEAGVDNLMAKVAPDRKKAGVNPFDTGRFQGEAGPQPEAYRCPIVGARGYPPRVGG